jgi:DNA-binding NtrC family response regulator
MREEYEHSDGVDTSLIELAARSAILARGAAARPQAQQEDADDCEIYGCSAPMQEVNRLIERVAPSNANVLIVGESGTGKELVANTIHRMSKGGGKPFIAINCGAVPANLIEAELFGHERGSFTGAVRTHKGCFERACGGTLFLDEVTEMAPELQAKLLRVLETGRFRRVGGDEEIEAKVRVISSTNRRPEKAVESGQLRSDLLYRLSVFPIELPPLRERGDDVELLADRFLAEFNAAEGTRKFLSSSSRQFLRIYSWPGNVRELKNVIQRAFILADHEVDIDRTIGVAHAPRCADGARDDTVTFQVGTTLAECERDVIFTTLAHCKGNKTRAAGILGVSVKTLYNRLNAYQQEAAGKALND